MLYAHKAQYFLRVIEPERAFYCADGRVCRSLDQLSRAFKELPDEVFNYHFYGEQNDFARWVREVVEDYYLALGLEVAKNRQEAAVRLQERINHWDRKLEELAASIENR